jgi:hypothetical protein
VVGTVIVDVVVDTVGAELEVELVDVVTVVEVGIG